MRLSQSSAGTSFAGLSELSPNSRCVVLSCQQERPNAAPREMRAPLCSPRLDSVSRTACELSPKNEPQPQSQQKSTSGTRVASTWQCRLSVSTDVALRESIPRLDAASREARPSFIRGVEVSARAVCLIESKPQRTARRGFKSAKRPRGRETALTNSGRSIAVGSCLLSLPARLSNRHARGKRGKRTGLITVMVFLPSIRLSNLR
jgi:hypothetical protein